MDGPHRGGPPPRTRRDRGAAVTLGHPVDRCRRARSNTHAGLRGGSHGPQRAWPAPSMQRIILGLLASSALAAHAHADGAEDKSPLLAVSLSIGVTAAGASALFVDHAGVRVTGVFAMLLGPSVGRWYAGDGSLAVDRLDGGRHRAGAPFGTALERAPLGDGLADGLRHGLGDRDRARADRPVLTGRPSPLTDTTPARAMRSGRRRTARHVRGSAP